MLLKEKRKYEQYFLVSETLNNGRITCVFCQIGLDEGLTSGNFLVFGGNFETAGVKNGGISGKTFGLNMDKMVAGTKLDRS